MANKNTMRNRRWRDGYREKRGVKVNTSVRKDQDKPRYVARREDAR